MSRQITLETLDRLDEIKADLFTVQAAIEGNPVGPMLACVGGTLGRIIDRYESLLDAMSADADDTAAGAS